MSMSIPDMRALRDNTARTIVAATARSYSDSLPASVINPIPPLVPVAITGTNSATTDYRVNFSYTPAPSSGATIHFGDGASGVANAEGDSHTYAGVGPFTATLRDTHGRTLGTVTVNPDVVVVEGETQPETTGAEFIDGEP